MPFGVQRGWMRYALPRPEILSYPLETNVIDSIVLNASGVAPDAAGPYMNRRYLVAGTILSRRPDDTYEEYTGITTAPSSQTFTLTFVGPPTGGSFALGIGPNATPQMPWPATAADLQTALDAFPNFTGLVTVTGPTTDTMGSQIFTVTFDPTAPRVMQIVTDPTQLTGPGNQDIQVQQTGGGGTSYVQNVAGILFDTVEFADGSDLSDEPVAMLRRNVSFKATAIVNFNTLNAAGAVVDALPTCEFV